jgi:hypothetical protein
MSVNFVAALDTNEHVFEALRFDGRVNYFLATHDSMLNFLVPGILLLVCLVSFAIDFGTVGVSAVAVLALGLMSLLGIIYVNWVSYIAFAVMIGVIIFRINRT